jgi:peptidoglycan hydrolase-like protein with peptidoglycan-binding domain
MFRSLRGGDDYAVKEMTTNATAWSRPFRRELQRLMKEAGVYDGAIDGNFDPATKRAIETLVAQAASAG